MKREGKDTERIKWYIYFPSRWRKVRYDTELETVLKKKTQTNGEFVEKSELRRKWRLCTYLTMLCSTIPEEDLREETY